MKILKGIASGMVMQRTADGCEIMFTAETTGEVRSTMGCVEKVGERFRLTGIPAGGPYDMTLSDDGGSVSIEGFYVGDVWLLGGQSNMEGAGLRRDCDREYDANPNPAIRAYFLDDSWRPACAGLHQQWMNSDKGVYEKYLRDNQRHLEIYGSFSLERNMECGVGPGLYCAKRMYELTGVPQAVIPCAYGGSGMGDWTPDNTSPESLYYSMIRRLRDCGSRVAGLFWHQGESEAHPVGVENYLNVMKLMISRLREDAENPDLPVVLGQIGHTMLPQAANPGSAAGWHGVKIQQHLLTEVIPHTALVSSANSYLQDLIHLDAQSQEEMGTFMAEEMHRLITGEGTPMPELVSAVTKPHPFRKGFYCVELSFRNVVGELVSEGRPYGFSVTQDDETPWEYPYRNIPRVELQDNKVLVWVEEAYLPPEKAHVWYGAGHNTVCTIRDGAGRPLYVFGPVKATSEE